MLGRIYIIFLMGTIDYNLSHPGANPKPLDTINININEDKGKVVDNFPEFSKAAHGQGDGDDQWHLLGKGTSENEEHGQGDGDDQWHLHEEGTSKNEEHGQGDGDDQWHLLGQGTSENEGCFIEPDYNYHGYSLGAPVTQVDWKACRDSAGGVANARYWTFRLTDKLCWLKSSNRNRKPEVIYNINVYNILEAGSIISGNADCREGGDGGNNGQAGILSGIQRGGNNGVTDGDGDGGNNGLAGILSGIQRGGNNGVTGGGGGNNGLARILSGFRGGGYNLEPNGETCVRHGITIWKGRYLLKTSRKQTANQCAHKCNTSSRCSFWNWNGYGKCFLKNNQSQIIPTWNNGGYSKVYSSFLSGPKGCKPNNEDDGGGKNGLPGILSSIQGDGNNLETNGVTTGNIPSPTPSPTLLPISSPSPSTTPTPTPQTSGCWGFSENVENLSFERIANLTESMRNLHASEYWERVTSMNGEPVRRECGFRACSVHGGTGGFLPWHRTYLDSFNGALASVMPYWDWTTSCFPIIALAGQFSHGLNILNSRDTNRGSSCIRTWGNLDAVLRALEEDDFLFFSTQLEDIHDTIHIRVGGSMGLLGLASYDPIFFLHHTFVDLVWAVYQVLKPNVQVPNLKQRLVPFSRIIGQTLSTNRYNLDINSNRIIFGDMTLAQIQNRISNRTREPDVHSGYRVYAGFIKRSYGTSGIIEFNICKKDDCSYHGGVVSIFGGRKQMPYSNSDPTKVDITDTVHEAGIDNIKQLKFKITSFTNLNERRIRKTIYAPIRIIRAGNGGRNPYGTVSNDVYCIFFNRNVTQPPKLRIPKNTMFEIDSPYQNVIATLNRNSYINCYKRDGFPQPSKTLINVKPGTYYFFDDDCEPQPNNATRINYVSKLQIIKE